MGAQVQRCVAQVRMNRSEHRRVLPTVTGLMPHLVRVISVCLVAFASACSDDGPTAPSPVDMQVTLAPGQTVGIDGTALGLRFEGVSGDSRCPIDAICILGGDATVHIAVLSPTTSTPYALHTGNMLPVRHGDLTIALVDLQPYPFSSLPAIVPADYRATIRATR